MPQPLILLGAGRNLYDVLDILDAINRVSPKWKVLGVVDDHREKDSDYIGLRVLGPLRIARTYDDCMFVSTIWNEKTFKVVHEILQSTQLERHRFASLPHPTATVSRRARLGRDVLIHCGVSVAGNVDISDHVSVGPGCIVGHDTKIESHTCFAAGAIVGGGVKVCRNSYIGSGAMIRQQIKIGEGALIGMGAVVVKDVHPFTTVVGNPGAVLNREPCHTVDPVCSD